MIVFILLVVVLSRVVWVVWSKRKMLSFHRQIGSDLSDNLISGHLAMMVGDDEKRMTTFRLLGLEAISKGGLTSLQVLYRFVLVVADYELAEVVFKNCLQKADIMQATRSLIGNGSIFAPVAIWRPRRKMVAPAFGQRNLNNFVQVFDKQSRTMVRSLKKHVGKEPFSVFKYMTAYAMDAICETNLGIEANIQGHPYHPFLLAFDEYCKMTGKRLCQPWLYNDTLYEMIPWYSVIREHINTMWKFVDDVIKDKRKHTGPANNNPYEDDKLSGKSLVELLMKPLKDEGFTDLELREELLVVTIASTDTSATGAAFVLSMLARSTSIRERVQKEIQEVFGNSDREVTPEDLQRLKYLDAVVRETLRLYPPVPITVRTTEQDIPLPNGKVIPKDCDILMNLWAIQRNPQHWGADAEEFKPERFLGTQQHPAFVAFSSGPRNCLGYQYAMMSMKTLLCNLLRHYSVRHDRFDDPVEKMNEPMRVKFDIMMKDVDNWRIRLVNKESG